VPLHKAPLHKLSLPVFCYVTDRSSLVPSGLHQNDLQRDAASLLASITAAAAAGANWIQLREKDLPARSLATLTRALLGAVDRPAVCEVINGVVDEAIDEAIGEAIHECAQMPQAPVTHAVANSLPAPPRILVNDRLDVAIAEHAGGLHLGENSLPVAEAKRLLRNLPAQADFADFLVGVSCHSLSSAQTAAAAGADYVFFGPVFPTPSKRVYGPAQGLPRLAEVCRSVSIPVVAIGGINSENAASCLDAGAAGIAAVRLFQEPEQLRAVPGLLRSLSLP
jgi:thiamine-phosphate diphosphorylase